jgi:zinc transport system ATP-binding protein
MISFEDVSVMRGAERVLDRVSLSVARGTVHAVVGRNGAGKSTLVSALLGALPFEGRITVRWARARRLGLVPQRIAIDPAVPLTVRDFLAASRQRWPVALGSSRAVRARIDAMLESQGLSGFAGRRLGALSGGELQRVMLAHALDPDPELLVLDEPNAGLDPAAQAHLEAALVAARGRGVTVLAILHDLALVERVADHVTHLDRRVVASGRPADVLSRRGLGWCA